MLIQYIICVQDESAGKYIVVTTKMKTEQILYEFISIKIDHLQVSVNPEPGLEDLLWLLLSSIFMFLRLLDRNMFTGILR